MGATCCGVGWPLVLVCWVAADGRQVGWLRLQKQGWVIGVLGHARLSMSSLSWCRAVLVARHRFPSAGLARCELVRGLFYMQGRECVRVCMHVCVRASFSLLQRLYSLHMLCS